MVFAIHVNAQIIEEIKSYVDSTELIVNNGRRMLVQKITEGDNLKAQEVYRFLTEQTANTNYSAFDFTEDIYINLLINDWHTTSDCVLEYDERIQKITYPNNFEIKTILYKSFAIRSDALALDCMNSDIDDESKKIIVLLLHLLKVGYVDEEYNAMLREYHQVYKTSSFNSFLSYYMPGNRIKASYGFSFGSGVLFTTDKLADNFTSNATYNMSLDFNIQKVFASLYFNGSGLKLKEPFTVISDTDSLSFKKNETFHFLDAGLKGGYFLVRNEKIQLAPYISISGGLLESSRYDTEDDGEEYRIFNSFTYGAGLHSEVKIKDFNYVNRYGYSSNNYLSLKLEAGYNIITKFDDSYCKGNTPYITLAFVWGLGAF